MERAANLLLSEEIKQAMAILPRNQSQFEVPQYLRQVATPLFKLRETPTGHVYSCFFNVGFKALKVPLDLVPRAVRYLPDPNSRTHRFLRTRS